MILKSQNDYRTAAEYLSGKDKKLACLIEHFDLPKFRRETNYFKALSRAIIYQQLNGKVATKILERFIGLFQTDAYPTPEMVVKKTIPALRQAGLSERKAEYIKSIARFFLDNHITPQKLNKLSNEEIKEMFVQIKGVGSWTVDMFMMFTLGRPDVLPVGDLGIRQGFRFLYDLEELPDEEFMFKKAKKWSPYRTVASIYLWNLANSGMTYKDLRKKER